MWTFCRKHRMENMQFVMSKNVCLFETDIVMSPFTHLSSAFVFPIGDFIVQLVSKDVPDVQLVAIFKQGGEWVSHIQGGFLLAFNHLQLEVRFAYLSCGEGRETVTCACTPLYLSWKLPF